MTAGDPRSGVEHQRRRAELLPGALNTLCALCERPMLRGQELELDHSDPLVTSPLGKGDRIVHARCNESAGGKLGSERARFNPSRTW